MHFSSAWYVLWCLPLACCKYYLVAQLIKHICSLVHHPGITQRVDARYWDQVDKEKELETAKKVSLQKRKGSLMIATQPTESWANPGG